MKHVPNTPTNPHRHTMEVSRIIVTVVVGIVVGSRVFVLFMFFFL